MTVDIGAIRTYYRTRADYEGWDGYRHANWLRRAEGDIHALLDEVERYRELLREMVALIDNKQPYRTATEILRQAEEALGDE